MSNLTRTADVIARNPKLRTTLLVSFKLTAKPSI